MPWKIVKAGSNYHVIKKDTGKVVGTHTTKAGAQKQLRALYANVPEARKA